MQETISKKMLREPNGFLKYKYIVPGSVYSDCLWDWDSWLTNLALRKIADRNEIEEYEKGCILNFLENSDSKKRMPIYIQPDVRYPDFKSADNQNVHKPCLALHALFVCEQNKSFEWLRKSFRKLEEYIEFYFENCRHETGLFFWLNDNAIGVDNDPCTFYRPDRSSASVYLNCMMYKELCAMADIAAALGYNDKKVFYNNESEKLKSAIREHMWDERNGFYYSTDIDLLPIALPPNCIQDVRDTGTVSSVKLMSGPVLWLCGQELQLRNKQSELFVRTIKTQKHSTPIMESVPFQNLKKCTK